MCDNLLKLTSATRYKRPHVDIFICMEMAILWTINKKNTPVYQAACVLTCSDCPTLHLSHKVFFSHNSLALSKLLLTLSKFLSSRLFTSLVLICSFTSSSMVGPPRLPSWYKWDISMVTQCLQVGHLHGNTIFHLPSVSDVRWQYMSRWKNSSIEHRN